MHVASDVDKTILYRILRALVDCGNGILTGLPRRRTAFRHDHICCA